MIALDGPTVSIGNSFIAGFPEISLGDEFETSRARFGDVLEEMPQDSIVLDQSQFAMIGMSDGSPEMTECSFTERDDFANGRRASMNGVYFGQLVVRSSHFIDSPELVAVKPHFMSMDTEDVVHEWAAGSFVNSVSSCERAYVPLGVWRDKKGMYQTVSVYDHAVQTYDNIFWARDEEAERITKSHTDESLALCLYGLGFLHGVGAIHGDAQVKNLATDRQCIRFVDLEEMELLPRNPDGTLVASESSQEQMESDVSTLLGSTLGFGHVDETVVSTLEDPLVRRRAQTSYHRGITRGANRNNVVFPSELRLDQETISSIFDNTLDMYRQSLDQ